MIRYFIISLLLAACVLADDSGQPKYRINTDYQLPRGKTTFLYGVFMIDHNLWPKATRIAVSKHGFGYVLQGLGSRRYRLTPFPIPPHELDEFVTLLEEKVQFASIHSKSNRNDEPYLIYMTAAYSQPSLSHLTQSVYADATDTVKPLYEHLHRWQKKANDAWVALLEAGKGPPTVAVIETDDIEFLEHLMDVMHYTSTWIREK